MNSGVIVSLGMLLPAAAPPTPVANALDESPRSYIVVAAESAFMVHVGRSGIFGFAGHEHEVVAPAFEGRIVADPPGLERSSVSLRFEAGAMRVTGRGEPSADVPEVQRVMLGPQVLDAARYPAIAFQSTSITGRALAPSIYELLLAGELELHGVRRPLKLPLRVEMSQGTLSATGTTKLRQSQFGIKPISVGGVVKVKDELGITFRIVAREQ